MINIPLKDFFRVGEELYGPDRSAWEFKCVTCGNVQSAKAVAERSGADLAKVEAWIMHECEGRHVDGRGCDWTLFGLLKLHDVEVQHPVSRAFIPVFTFAHEAALDRLRAFALTRPVPTTAATRWSEFAWPAWVPADVRLQIETFWDDTIGRSPAEWEQQRCERWAPDLGAEVTMRKVAGEERVQGRFVYAWNNIARVIDAAGRAHVVAF